MFNLHDLYATDVVPIRCNSNTVHSFVIRFAPQVVIDGDLLYCTGLS